MHGGLPEFMHLCVISLSLPPLAGMLPLHIANPFSQLSPLIPALGQPSLDLGQHTLTSPCCKWGHRLPAPLISLLTKHHLNTGQASTHGPGSWGFMHIIVTVILQLINLLVIQVQPYLNSDPHKS